MKNFLPVLLLFVFAKGLHAQQSFQQDTLDIRRLILEARQLINASDDESALAKLDSLPPLVTRSIGLKTLEYAMYLHLKAMIDSDYGNSLSAIRLSEEALDLRKSLLGETHSETLKTTNNLANAHFQLGDLRNALRLYRTTLDARIRVLGPTHPDVAVSSINLANIMHAAAQFDSAMVYQQRSIQILEHPTNQNRKDEGMLATLYYNMGNTYFAIDERQKALEYIRQSLAIRERLFGAESLETAYSLYGLGNMHLSMGEGAKGITYHRKALNIRLKKLKPGHTLIASSYGNLGAAFAEVGQSDSSLYYQKKALEYSLSAPEPSELDISFAEGSLGMAFYQKEMFDDALPHLYKGLALRQKIYGTQHYLIARSFTNLATCYASMDNYDKALEYLQEALKANRYNGVDAKGVFAFPELTEALALQGETHYRRYKAGAGIPALQAALSSLKKARSAYDYRRGGFEQESAENDTNEAQIRQTDELLVEVAYRLWRETGQQDYLHHCFETVEKTKAWALFQSIKGKQALRFADIPDTLRQKENALRTEIGFLEKNIFDEESNGVDANLQKIEAQNALLIQKKADWESLLTRLERENPAYYNLKHNQKVAGAAAVQQRISASNQTVLAYYLGDRTAYVFLLKKDAFTVDTLPLDSIKQWVNQLRNSLDRSFNNQGLKIPSEYKKGIVRYQEAAFQLHRVLIDRFDRLMTAADTNLVLIPDGALNYLPFELLLTQKPKNSDEPKSYPYLLHRYLTSYQYSATLWREMSVLKDSLATAVLPYFGMAPYESVACKSDPLNTLKTSAEEVESAQNRFGGKVYKGAAATKAQFVKQLSAEPARIVHLSTHGVVKDSNSLYTSSIAFYSDASCDSLKNKLFMREIYEINMPGTEVILLSACKTASGQLRRGEGIISLARAFAYAGVPTIVPTLWSVNETPTKDIFVALSAEIGKGAPKDQALRIAKRHYLQQPGNDGHPYWWAGIIAIGDMRPIAIK